jgi:outer membrane immunogenic protein
LIGGLGVVDAKVASSAGGGVAGSQIGYRWQATNWVFGLEAPGDWADCRADRSEKFAESTRWVI